MSTWNEIAQNNGGSADYKKAEFAKFPEGDTFVKLIDSEPIIRWVHWLPKFNRAINCPGKGCPICEIRKAQKANKEDYSYSMARRFAMNIINYSTGKQEIMEQGQGFFEDLRDLLSDLQEKNKTFVDVKLRVRRRGKGQHDTSYRIDIHEDKPLDDKEKEMIAEKIDLAEYFKPHTNEQVLRIVNGETWDEVMMNNENIDNKVNEQEVEYKVE